MQIIDFACAKVAAGGELGAKVACRVPLLIIAGYWVGSTCSIANQPLLRVGWSVVVDWSDFGRQASHIGMNA